MVGGTLSASATQRIHCAFKRGSTTFGVEIASGAGSGAETDTKPAEVSIKRRQHGDRHLIGPGAAIHGANGIGEIGRVADPVEDEIAAARRIAVPEFPFGLGEARRNGVETKVSIR